MDWRFEKCGVLAPKSKADWAFNLHIIEYLADDGIALVINFPGILYRGNREQKIRKWIVEQNYIDKIIQFPANEFTDTAIATVGIVYRKDKKNTDIEFIDEINNIRKMVTLEEIIKNDYKLSVSTYIQKEEKKEEIDILELEKEILKITFSNIEKRIKGDRQNIELTEGLFTQKQNEKRKEEYNTYLVDIVNLCKENIFEIS